MDIRIEDRGGYVVAELQGRFDSASCQAVSGRLQDLVPGAGGTLAIDLSRVELLDSSGLGLLVDLTARARMREARVVLVAPSVFIQGVLKVTKLDTWLDVVRDLEKLREPA